MLLEREAREPHPPLREHMLTTGDQLPITREPDADRTKPFQHLTLVFTLQG